MMSKVERNNREAVRNGREERGAVRKEWEGTGGEGRVRGRSRGGKRSAGASARETRSAGAYTRGAGRVRSGRGRNAGGQEEIPGAGEGQGVQETKGMSPYRIP